MFTNYRMSSCHSRIKSLVNNNPGVLVLVSSILGVPDKALLPHNVIHMTLSSIVIWSKIECNNGVHKGLGVRLCFH